MAALLLLDLWIQNEDRSLSAKGGNPNLMVTQIPPLPDWDEEGALWKNQPRREMLWAYDFFIWLSTRILPGRDFLMPMFSRASSSSGQMDSENGWSHACVKL
jgi:hypothetical protein